MTYGDKNRGKSSRRYFLKLAVLTVAAFTPIIGVIDDPVSYLVGKVLNLPSKIRSVSGKFDMAILQEASALPQPQGGSDWKRRWTMVIDLERCQGVGNCVKACQQMHNTPEDQYWMELFVFRDEEVGKSNFLPRPCMQCENAPCVKVCPVGANYYDEDGIVIIDKERCIGCRLCMAACPYGARSFNWWRPQVDVNLHDVTHTDNPTGKDDPTYNEYRHYLGTTAKCMWCGHRLRAGKLPACVEACPNGALFIGDAHEDLVTNGRETVRLSKLLQKSAYFRLYEELGTKPRVIYLPAATGKPDIPFPLKE